MSLDNLDGQITPNDLIDLGIATRDSNGRLSSGGSLPSVALDLVKVVLGSTADGHGGVPIRVKTKGASGTLWAGDNSNGFWKSTDEGDTWTKTATLTGYNQCDQVLELSTGTLLAVVHDSTPVYHILRSTDSGATWTKKMDFNAASLGVLGQQSFVEDTGASPKAIYVGEYCPTNQASVNLYKSTDDGATWTAVYSFAQGVVRHIHGVFVDPYVTSRVWMTVGDTGTQPRIGYSDDGGVTFTWITQSQYPESRAVALMFTATEVMWIPDTPDERAPVYKWNRANQQISTIPASSLLGVDGNFNTPVYYAVNYAGMFAAVTAVELASGGYTGDQFVHFIVGDGSNFMDYAQWYRQQDDATRGSKVTGLSDCDVDGYFWMCVENLADTKDIASRVVNLKFQLVSRPFPFQSRPNLREIFNRKIGERPFEVTFAEDMSANTNRIITIVPYDMVITQADFGCITTVTTDGTNYWTGSLRHYRAGSFVADISQYGGASVTWTAFSDNAGSTSSLPYIVKKGDVLLYRVDRIGAPSNLTRPSINFLSRKYDPAVQ